MADRPKPTDTAEPEAGEGFLKRWSRKKRSAVETEPATPELVDIGPAEAGTSGDETPPAIDPADLPDIDSLTAESDFSVFMREGVPEELRRLALRKLWLSDPVLANLDGLNDYDEDFSLVGTVVEKITTAYKAGKGYLDEEQEEDVENDLDDDLGDGDLEGDAVDALDTPDTGAAQQPATEGDDPTPDPAPDKT